jgi:hypothetical protein
MSFSSGAKAAVFLLAVASAALTIVVYLSPTLIDRSISLVTVSPSMRVTDGPSVSIGIFGMKPKLY